MRCGERAVSAVSQDVTDAVQALQAAFQRIGAERMRGLPMVNPRLSVETVGFRPWQDHVVGVLIAPWLMNLIALPGGDDNGWQRSNRGERVELEFPAGRYQFDACLREDGRWHLSLPLFSTVLDFPNQTAARRVAEEVLDRLFAEQGRSAAPGAEDLLTRRALLSL